MNHAGSERRVGWFPVASCFLVLVLAGFASADVTSVTVDSSTPFEQVSGYTYVEATIHGTIERADGVRGAYAVPLILIYPDDGGNGVGVVDWVNTAVMRELGFIEDATSIRQLALWSTGTYLFDEGYTYAAVQWDKAVTDVFGEAAPDDDPDRNHLAHGVIEDMSDAFEILRDAALFLRDPSSYEGVGGPLPVQTVLSFGYSQGGIAQMTFLSRGENLRDDELVYDGHLVGKAGLRCASLDGEPPGYVEPAPCEPEPVGDGSKVIVIAAQTDVEAAFNAGRSRFPDEPNWRQYELAGVSHLPAAFFPVLHQNQNPVSSQPVFRAALHNLVSWTTEGVPAPSSAFLEGTLNSDGTFDAKLDDDGNALGGLRLPHMQQVVDGEEAGAPRGTYGGVNLDVDPEVPEAVFVMLGGTFEPFSDDELRERYQDDETYLSRVTRAADYLLHNRYILEEDRDAYVRAARLPGRAR